MTRNRSWMVTLGSFVAALALAYASGPGNRVLGRVAADPTGRNCVSDLTNLRAKVKVAGFAPDLADPAKSAGTLSAEDLVNYRGGITQGWRSENDVEMEAGVSVRFEVLPVGSIDPPIQKSASYLLKPTPKDYSFTHIDIQNQNDLKSTYEGNAKDFVRFVKQWARQLEDKGANTVTVNETTVTSQLSWQVGGLSFTTQTGKKKGEHCAHDDINLSLLMVLEAADAGSKEKEGSIAD